MAFHLRRQQRDLDLSSLTPIHAGRKKRQLSQMSSPASSRASSPRSKMSKRSKHSERPLARIEMLPAELLAQIFSYTCNLALPQASKELGEKLSDEAVYRAYFSRLFWQVDLYKKHDVLLRVGDHIGKAYTIPSCVVDEHAETQSYKTKVLLCKWMTAERFERYRGDILASIRNVPNTEQLELFMEVDDRAQYQSGLHLYLPTTLLRYRPHSGSGTSDRGFELFRVLLRYYLICLDPLDDANERVRDIFYQALLKDDYQLVYLIMRNSLYERSWTNEVRDALEKTENAPRMWNLVYLMSSEQRRFSLFHRDNIHCPWRTFNNDMQILRDTVDDDFPGACDPVTCFPEKTLEDFGQALAKTGDSYWTEQAEFVTDYLRRRSEEYMPTYLRRGGILGYRHVVEPYLLGYSG